MKRLYKFLSLVFVCSGFLFYSCETTDINLTKNPNALTPDQADVDFFLNGIEVSFGRFVETMGNRGGQMTRIDYMFGRDYPNAYSPTTFDGAWRLAYRNIRNNIIEMEPLASEAGLTNHLGIGQVIEAYTMVTLVDFFGDVPLTEANDNVTNNLNPKADSGASIYDAALALLDAAIANFNAPALADPQNDFFYDNDFSKWIKAANTLKMKIYMQRRLVDSGAMTSFNNIVASGNFIATSADDFQFKWGSNEVQPDTRHPRYAADYAVSGAESYRSNWLMNLMNSSNDPRIRYYFYRQTDAVPGIDGTPPNEETLQCSLQTAPTHYAGFTFCGVSNGYWGRDHGNDEGIPPDGFLRTVTGVYPAAGNFDDDRFGDVGLGQGGQGAGVTPIMLASTSHFMMAEAAMVAGDMGAAANHLRMAIEASIDKVQTFGSLDPDADLTFEPSSLAVGVYVDGVISDFEDPTATPEDKWNILAEQFWVSLYGNGIDAYNFYRRTGYPTTLQPNIEPNPGAFIRSVWYPSAYADRNANASQKSSVSQQVFWDTNPPSPGFPASN